MPLFSPFPVAILTDSFPSEFLVACCHGEGPALNIDSEEAVQLGIEPSSRLEFTMNYRGTDHWSVCVWPTQDNQHGSSYLTEQALMQMKRVGNRSWVIRD